MPIVSNNFDRFTDTGAANRAALTAMGAACKQAVETAYDVLKIKKPTGNLFRSHTVHVTDNEVRIGVTADYGGYVHNGTYGHSGRPWLRTGASQNEQSIKEAGQRAWEREMR